MSPKKAIAERLLQRDYRIAECSEGNQDCCLTFIKYNGVLVYCVIVVDTDADNYRERYNSVREKVYIIINRLKCERAFVSGVFTGESEKAGLRDFVTVNIEDYSEKIIETRWLADVGEKKVKVYGSQPDKMDGLEKIINEALSASEEGDSSYTNLGELLANEMKNRRKSLKSSNIVLTLLFIIANLLMLTATYGTGGIDTENMLRMGAMERTLVFGEGQYYRLISSMFLHYGVMHIMSNMLFLYVFGSSIERYYGKLKYFVIYIGSGIFAGLSFCLFSNGAGAGASGAVFGLTGAMLACSKRLKRAVDGKDSYFMILFAIISICAGFMSDEVANSAHIGGFVFGLLSGYILYSE